MIAAGTLAGCRIDHPRYRAPRPQEHPPVVIFEGVGPRTGALGTPDELPYVHFAGNPLKRAEVAGRAWPMPVVGELAVYLDPPLTSIAPASPELGEDGSFRWRMHDSPRWLVFHAGPSAPPAPPQPEPVIEPEPEPLDPRLEDPQPEDEMDRPLPDPEDHRPRGESEPVAMAIEFERLESGEYVEPIERAEPTEVTEPAERQEAVEQPGEVDPTEPQEPVEPAELFELVEGEEAGQDIHVAFGNDADLTGRLADFGPVVRRGIYDDLADPSVAIGAEQWVMALTAVRDGRSWIAIVTSADGLDWTPRGLEDEEQEIEITGGEFASISYPSLIYNDERQRWELYFLGQNEPTTAGAQNEPTAAGGWPASGTPDGTAVQNEPTVAANGPAILQNEPTAGGNDPANGGNQRPISQNEPTAPLWGLFLAVSDQQTPGEFRLVRQVQQGWAKPAVRRLVDGRYLAAFRLPEDPDLHYALGEDGERFGEPVRLLAEDPVAPARMSAPAWAVGHDGRVAALMFNSEYAGRPQFSVAFPQYLVQVTTPTGVYNMRRADSPDAQQVWIPPAVSARRVVLWRHVDCPVAEYEVPVPLRTGQRTPLHVPRGPCLPVEGFVRPDVLPEPVADPPDPEPVEEPVEEPADDALDEPVSPPGDEERDLADIIQRFLSVDQPVGSPRG